LQAMGCLVALDDFGSGYTSFRQLKAISVDMVKIDGAFVKDIAQSADNQFFVKTLMQFAQGFGLQTVAEFVENGEIAKILMEMGVDYLQGYYLGKPENHRRWLNEGEYKNH
jgi:EAL domain-containing protein (putative c-di-GMP-specific phosphodiesterase class I)